RVAKTGAVRFAEIRPLARKILEGLIPIHERRLAHGDLRLENVLLVPNEFDPNDEHTILLDAGSDHLRAPAPVVNGQGGRFGTLGSPSTVAPELIEGKVSDPRSDVYAFGSLLY